MKQSIGHGSARVLTTSVALTLALCALAMPSALEAQGRRGGGGGGDRASGGRGGGSGRESGGRSGGFDRGGDRSPGSSPRSYNRGGDRSPGYSGRDSSSRSDRLPGSTYGGRADGARSWESRGDRTGDSSSWLSRDDGAGRPGARSSRGDRSDRAEMWQQRGDRSERPGAGPAREERGGRTDNARPGGDRGEARDRGGDRSRIDPGNRTGDRSRGDAGDRAGDRSRFDSGNRTGDRSRFDPGNRPGGGLRGDRVRPNYGSVFRRDSGSDRFRYTPSGSRSVSRFALRDRSYITDRHLVRYFPHRYSYYPYYYGGVDFSLSVYCSPFYFYYGVCPPYIYRSHVWYSAPPVVYVEVPIYVGDEYRGYRDGRDDYYLERRYEEERWKDEPDLKRAVYDLEDAFRSNDSAALTQLTDPDAKIAIFAKGRYEYTLAAGDYIDMTRDFMQTARTTDFAAYKVRQKTDGVYQVFARHTYRGDDGQTREVYLCIVLERISGRWTMTQVDTSPDRIQN